LLRVLQEREFVRVGGTRSIKLNVRFLPPLTKIYRSSFRRQLSRGPLSSLNVISFTLPPLREHAQDIPLLAEYFAARYAKRCNRDVQGISAEARAASPNMIGQATSVNWKCHGARRGVGSSTFILRRFAGNAARNLANVTSLVCALSDAVRNLKSN